MACQYLLGAVHQMKNNIGSVALRQIILDGMPRDVVRRGCSQRILAVLPDKEMAITTPG